MNGFFHDNIWPFRYPTTPPQKSSPLISENLLLPLTKRDPVTLLKIFPSTHYKCLSTLKITEKLTPPKLPRLITVINKILSTMFFLWQFISSSTNNLIKRLIHMKQVTTIFSCTWVNVIVEDPKNPPLGEFTTQNFPTLT